MLRRRVALCTAVALLGSSCTSDREARPPDRADAGNDSGETAASDGLRVGYGQSAMGWRVGAKPGQVGTPALPERDQLLADSVGTLLPILQGDLPEADLARQMTDWLMTQLEDRVAKTEPGRYASLFEPGRGIELPPDVKALVVERGAEKVALVRADLYIMHEHLHRRVTELVADQTGLSREQIFLVATHNHSAPHALSPSAGVWILADGFDPRHFVYATHRIAEAILEADANLRPAELRVVKEQFQDVQRNVIGPGTNEVENPSGALETVEVGYPRTYVDPDLLMLRFDAPGGEETIASLFVFGMHPESLPSGHGIISGEWPTHVELALQDRLGSPFVWMPGPLGDSEPDDGAVEPTHGFFRGGFDSMAQMVGLLVEAADDAFHAAGDEPGDPQPTFSQVAVDIPGTADFPLPTSEYLGDGLRLPMLRLIEDSAVYRLHVVRLGPAALLGAPAEITTDLALNIKSRVDRIEDNVHQGYVWPGAPMWVSDRIGRNFGTAEIAPSDGFELPMIVSHVNGYMGYIVTAWEYESHSHYREDMTALGPGTADHVANAFLEMTRSLAPGAEPYAPALPSWRDADLEGVETVAAFLRGLEDRVATMSRDLPVSDPSLVGTIVTQPVDTAGGQSVSVSWNGGTNDLPPPRVLVERNEGDTWAPVTEGPSADIWVLYDGGSVWTATWNSAVTGAQPLRFRIEGAYRSDTPGSSEPDPLFDPEGQNADYEATSATFMVAN